MPCVEGKSTVPRTSGLLFPGLQDLVLCGAPLCPLSYEQLGTRHSYAVLSPSVGLCGVLGGDSAAPLLPAVPLWGDCTGLLEGAGVLGRGHSRQHGSGHFFLLPN